jgi:hypothetical protein
MNIQFVLYNEAGEIVGWQNVEPLPRDVPQGCNVSLVEVAEGRAFSPDPVLHRFDHLTGEIVDKSPVERAQSLLPKAFEVRVAISQEMAATDGFVAADRPLSQDLRAAWVIYRQALRDLSKLDGPVAMVKAWPERPSGPDPISSLRARI